MSKQISEVSLKGSSELLSFEKTAKWGRKWLFDVALPYWNEEGIDREQGGSFEAMDMKGAPIKDMVRRFRVQARQVYAFSHAYELGWKPGLEAMRHPLDFMFKYCWREDGGWGHLYLRNGSCVDDRVDTYDQAFALFGLGWAYKVTGEPRILMAAKATSKFLLERLRHPQIGFLEGLPEAYPRRANPHMHLFEMAMSWVELFQDEEMTSLAEEMFKIYHSHFCVDGLLRENFNEDFSPIDEWADTKYKLLEPGHLVEWASLLRRYEALTGKNSDSPALLEAFTDSWGKAPLTGLLANQCHPNGASTDLIKCRLWPQTEYIRIKLNSDNPDRIQQGLRMVELLKEYYLTVDGTIQGYWYDEVDGEGKVLSSNAPASTLYHLIGAFLPLLQS